MSTFILRAKVFLASEDGPAATEYAVMLGLIVVGAAAALSNFGERVWAIYSAINVITPT